MARLFDDTTSDYLSQATPPLTGSPLTIAAWIQTDDLTVTQVVASIGASGSTHQYSLIVAGAAAGDPLRATVTNSVGNVTGFTPAVTAGWHSAIAVFASDTQATAYLDGTTTASGLGFGGSVSGIDRYFIGRRANNGTANYFSGDIAEVAVWNVALSLADALEHATGISARQIRPQNLISHCEILGENSPEIERRQGLSMTLNSGTLANPVWSPHPRRCG